MTRITPAAIALWPESTGAEKRAGLISSPSVPFRRRSLENNP